MLRFPINMELKGCTLSTFSLHDKWTISCSTSKDHDYRRYLVSLMHHGKAPDEGILVSGRLSLTISRPAVGDMTFSFYWHTGYESMDLGHLESDEVTPVQTLYLIGDITIVSDRHKCFWYYSKESGEKCVQQKSLTELSNNFQRLLSPQEPSFSDVTLICGDVSIPAHKNILSARSPYFFDMFTHPVNENLENEVHITDTDEAVFKTMMMFIYSGKTPNLTVSFASDLLLAAEKYRLQDLKEVCCAFLKNKITSDNLVSLLLFGDSPDESLKSKIIDYIHRHWHGETHCNFAIFEEREDWKILKNKRPDLAIDILGGIIRRRENFYK